MAEATSQAAREEGTGQGGPEHLLERPIVDVLLVAWAGLYALYAVHLVGEIARMLLRRPTELVSVVVAIAFAAVFVAAFVAAATDRLPAGGYLLVGALELHAAFGLLRSGTAWGFRSRVDDGAVSGLFLAGLVVATVLLSRGLRRVQDGESLLETPTDRD